MVAGKLVYIALALVSQAVASALLLQSVWKWPLPVQGVEEPVHYSQLHRGDWPIDLSRYEGTMVIRVDFKKHQEFRNFLLLNKHGASVASTVAYKVWAKLETQGYIDLEIDEENFLRLVERFSTREAPLLYRVIIEDLPQRVFESYPAGYASLGEHEATAEQQVAWERWSGALEARVFETAAAKARANVSYANTRTYSELFFREYRPIDTIEAWLDILVQTFPDILRIEKIGETYEHREYKVVHLSTQPRDGSDHERKQTIVITGGVHAREWISVSLVCYTIYGLLQYYTEHPDQRGILEKLDFLFIPILNPDGYVYSWELDRLWRKNRQETTFPKCFGIDIDHSYDYHWTKLTDWACGEEYSGEVPFEAIESQIWDDYLNSTNHNHAIEGYIDLHSYSQEILYPYAYLCQQQPRDEENLIELAYGISKAIRMQGGKNYEVLPACIDKDLDLQPDLGSGSSLDYMYHNKAYWAYQLKLRDSGSHGFLLPGKYIEPVGKEILAGIRYFCSFLLRDD